jgi:hypothetical protein
VKRTTGQQDKETRNKGKKNQESEFTWIFVVDLIYPTHHKKDHTTNAQVKVKN